MKKIFIIMMLLGLTGCNSGQLTNTCTKEETTGTLTTTTTYIIEFKNDNISNIDVSLNYQDRDSKMITDLKKNTELENRFLTVEYEVLEDNQYQYAILYHVPSDSDEEMKTRFNFQDKRTKFVKDLKEQGFTCK